MERIKPTHKDPVTTHGQEFDKDYRKTVIKTAPEMLTKLTEVDNMLNEKEQSLKKKIFSLSKMEALVFSDPVLSVKYEGMAENGEEKYGYHYNETIMNMLFNDYVLNSPKYLQKYKMAIPKEKKRRDKSGINQLKKAGIEKMDATGTKLEKPKKEETNENSENMNQPEDDDCFVQSNGFKLSVSCGSKFIGEFNQDEDAFNAVKQWKEKNNFYPNTWFVSDHGNLSLVDDDGNALSESTSAGSAGGAAGYVGYAGPAAFSSKGDLSGDFKGDKKKKKVNPKAKPISTGFALSETNYLVDPSGFEKYIEMLNEDAIQETSVASGSGQFSTKAGDKKSYEANQIDTDKQWKDLNTPEVSEIAKEKKISDKKKSKTKPVDKKNYVGGSSAKPTYAGGKIVKNPNNTINEEFESKAQQRYFYAKANDKSLPSDERSKWKKRAEEFSDDTDFNEIPEKLNEYLMYNALLSKQIVDTKPKSDEQPFTINGDKYEYEWGVFDDGTKDIVVYSFSDDVYYDHDKWRKAMGIDENLNEDINDLIDFDVPTWAASALINADESGLSDEDQVKLNAFVDKVVAQYGNANFMLGDIDGKDNLGFQPTNDIDNLGSDVYRLYINPSKEINNEDMLQETHLKTREDKVKFIKKNHPDGTKMNCGKKSDEEVNKLYLDTEKKMKSKDVDPQKVDIEEDSVISDNGETMANKPQPEGDLGNEVPMGTQQQGGLNEDIKLLEEINRELDAFSIHNKKLKDIAEDKKTPSMVIGDRVRGENPKNFKQGLQNSGTKEVIDVEKELQWKDQQTEVDNDPQKLGQDIEKKAIKTAEMKGDEALKNVGNSTNHKGDEIPKRNLTSKEQEEVDLYRKGQHSLDYDNEPSERFVDRMKADQGDFFEMGEKQKEFQAGANLYNKEPQPVQDTEVDKVQFDKDVKKKGDRVAWNERMGLGSDVKLSESMVTGRYIDVLNKRRLIEFNLPEVKTIKKIDEDVHMKLSFDGLGNTYMGRTVDKKVVVNESIVGAMNKFQFYTDGKKVFAIENQAKKLNENKQKEQKPVVNEQQEKMKHLLGYKPQDYINTKNIRL